MPTFTLSIARIGATSQAVPQKKASSAYDRLDEVGVAFHALVKGVLTERLGVDCGVPRPPGLPMTDEQRAAIGRIVSEMELAKAA